MGNAALFIDVADTAGIVVAMEAAQYGQTYASDFLARAGKTKYNPNV